MVSTFSAALAGFGPYVPAYLADQKWTQTDIGLVLTVGSIAGLLSQLPGSEVLDKVRSKRAVIAVGASIVILSAVIVAFWLQLASASSAGGPGPQPQRPRQRAESRQI